LRRENDRGAAEYQSERGIEGHPRGIGVVKRWKKSEHEPVDAEVQVKDAFCRREACTNGNNHPQNRGGSEIFEIEKESGRRQPPN
jgi:hypothetical protein